MERQIFSHPSSDLTGNYVLVLRRNPEYAKVTSVLWCGSKFMQKNQEVKGQTHWKRRAVQQNGILAPRSY